MNSSIFSLFIVVTTCNSINGTKIQSEQPFAVIDLESRAWQRESIIRLLKYPRVSDGAMCVFMPIRLLVLPERHADANYLTLFPKPDCDGNPGSIRHSVCAQCVSIGTICRKDVIQWPTYCRALEKHTKAIGRSRGRARDSKKTRWQSRKGCQ